MVETGFAIGLIMMLFWTPYLMAVGVESLNGEVSFGQKIKCFIPVFNIINAERNYFGKVHMCGISTLIFTIVTIVKFCTWFFLNQMGPLNFITNILWLLSILLLYIGNCVFVYIVIHDADGLSMIKLIFATIIYPIGQAYIGYQLANVIRNAQKEESTFRA